MYHKKSVEVSQVTNHNIRADKMRAAKFKRGAPSMPLGRVQLSKLGLFRKTRMESGRWLSREQLGSLNAKLK